MPRPKTLPPETKALYLHVPVTLVERLDAWAAEVRGALMGGSGVTRTDLIRDILTRAVEEHEGERKGKRR